MTDPKTFASADTQVNEAELSIPIGDLQWTKVLPMLLAAIEDGTPTGVRMAKEYLAQMAAAADLAGLAISALMSAHSRGVQLDADVVQAIDHARRAHAGRKH